VGVWLYRVARNRITDPLSPWVLMDFHSPRRFLAATQDWHNRKGLISDQGKRKEAFYVLQRFYWERDQSSEK
jgi:beta-glucuronidase